MLVARSAPGGRFLRRARGAGLGVFALATLLVSVRYLSNPSSADTVWLLAATAGLALLSVFMAFGWLAAYRARERERHLSAAESARRDGAALAINTLRHHIGNKLAVTVGYAELLADDPRLPPDAQELAEKATNSALAAGAALRRFRGRPVNLEVDTTTMGPPILNADAWNGAAARLAADAPALPDEPETESYTCVGSALPLALCAVTVIAGWAYIAAR
jgi:hypothetical protein